MADETPDADETPVQAPLAVPSLPFSPMPLEHTLSSLSVDGGGQERPVTAPGSPPSRPAAPPSGAAPLEIPGASAALANGAAGAVGIAGSGADAPYAGAGGGGGGAPPTPLVRGIISDAAHVAAATQPAAPDARPQLGVR